MSAPRSAPSPAQSPPLPQEAPERNSPWLTAEQLAEYLSISYSTVAHWVATGVVPCHYIPPGFRLVRFHRDEIDDWMRAR